MQQIATLLCVLGIVGLFLLERDREAKTSLALWLPVAWLAINSSRAVSQWLEIFGFGSTTYQMTPDQYLEGSPIDRAVYIALMVLGLVAIIQRRGKIGRILRENGPILLFFLYGALSICWSDFPDVTFKRWIKALGDVVMVLIVLVELDRTAAVKRLFSRVGFVLVPFSILFIRFYGRLGRGYSRGGSVAFVGVTTNKNLLGMIVLIFGVACIWRLLLGLRAPRSRRKTGPLVAQGIFLAMVVWLLWKANSATSLSCFLIASALLVTLSLARPRRKQALAHVLVFAAISVALVALFVAPTLLSTVGRDSTLTGRTEIWSQVLGVRNNRWLGAGFESFWLGPRLESLWNAYYFHLNEAHNGYLEIFVTLGWIGIILFANVVIKGYRNILSLLRFDSDLAQLWLAFFVVALIYNCTESATRMGTPVWIMLLMVTMAIPRPHPPRNSAVNSSSVDGFRTLHPQPVDEAIPLPLSQDLF